MKLRNSSRQEITRSYSSCTDALEHTLSLDFSLEKISLRDDPFVSSWSFLAGADDDGEMHSSPIDTKSSRKRKLTVKGFGSSESRRSCNCLDTLVNTNKSENNQTTAIRHMKSRPNFDRSASSQKLKVDSWGYFVDAIE